MSPKNFGVMKVYGAHLFKGVDERRQLISTKEHRAAVLYLSCCYKLQDCRATQLMIIKAIDRSCIYMPNIRSEEMSILKGIYLAVNGRSVPEKPQRKLSESSVSSEVLP